MPAEIRRATKHDAAQIAEIIAEISSDPDHVGFAETLSAEEVVAWNGRQVLGFAALDFDSSQPSECSFEAWLRARNRRQGHGTALAEEALAFARERGYKRIRARLPEDNEPARSYLSSIGAMVPIRNPGTSFELPIYQERE